MADIRAFVAHSFSDADRSVILAFLQYLDQIKKARPDFDWEHAEGAEPRELAEKVLALIADKNVCIAVCTKNERVISPDQLKAGHFQRDVLKGRSTDFSWKTTDWIIQEIGLAKGRGLDLIILLEDGVRRPGGLQGNIEYISFCRAAPERAFGKILEMIQALTPQNAAALPATAEKPQVSLPEARPKSDEDWREPRPNWDFSNYWLAMFDAIYRHSEDDQKKIDQAYRSSSEATSPASVAKWRATVELLKIQYGSDGSLDALKKISDEAPDNSEVFSALAQAYSKLGETKEAASAYECAAEKSPEEQERLRFKCCAAAELAKGGDLNAALVRLEAVKPSVTGPALERILLQVIIEIADITRDKDTAIIARERIVENFPDDVDARFDLAYHHAELGNDDLALIHYARIPSGRRTPMAWNNLGVTLDKFSMPGKTVDAYREAARQGETLSMSNLGHRLMNAGFFVEAEAEFKQALSTADFHPNAAIGIAALKNMPAQEDTKLKDVLQKFRRKADFYRLCGQAIAKPTVTNLPSRWIERDYELTVSISNNEFHAVGSYERDLSNFLAMALTPTTPKSLARFSVKYRGRIVGRQIEATVKRKRVDQISAASTLGIGDDEKKVLLVISDDAQEINVMEASDTASPTFFSIKLAM